MRRLISEVKEYDVVHAHSFFNLRYLWLAKMLFGLKTTIFYHEHLGLRSQMQPTSWQKYILPKTIFISTTESIANWAITQLQVPQNSVFTLPNIVVKEEVTLYKKSHTGVMQLVLVSNIKKEKNIEFAIRLLAQLNKTTAEYHLTIIGKIHDPAYFGSLEELMTETATTAFVSFIHDADNVQQLLPQYYIGLHTSPSESGPLAVIEYIAQGLPFVAYNTGEVITTIKDELGGCIAYSFDTEEWIEKVRRLLQADKTALQQKLQSVFAEHFSAEAYYRQCLDIYESGLRK